MTYRVSIKRVDAQPIAAVRRRAMSADLATTLPSALGEVWKLLRARGMPGSGRNIAIYHNGVIDLECGVEVPADFRGAGEVFLSATPAGLAAHTEHTGPYHLLGAANKAIADWCAAQGKTLAGPSWEVYGHWHEDPARLTTDVFYLLQP
jgi:effector-binding domain-containing protein